MPRLVMSLLASRRLSTEYVPVARTADGVIYKLDMTKKTQLTALLRP